MAIEYDKKIAIRRWEFANERVKLNGVPEAQSKALKESHDND